MKCYSRYFAVFVTCISLVLLCSCSHEASLVGTWNGDGSLDMLGMEAPYEFATQWIFDEEGTVIVKVGEEELEYQYSATDDTLTLNGSEISWGVRYEVNGKQLSIDTGGDKAVFKKIS